MGVLNRQVGGFIENSSWIRRMFEAGAELKKRYGEENVFDFSLGNPDLPPPPDVGAALRALADTADRPFAFGYMPNAGYPDLRSRLAGHLGAEQGVVLEPGHVLVTCGAAGGLNVILRAVLEPGEEVLCPAPFFVEYTFYAQNFGGVLRPVPCRTPDFGLDLEAMAAALSEKTRVVLINSPNNPTGRIYGRDELEALAGMLREHGAKTGRPVFLISDEPYRFQAYDGIEVPSVLPLYGYALVVSSFSKNLSLAGARLGYVIVNPAMPEGVTLMNGLILANRILGFVNAPAIAQQILGRVLGSGVDVSVYDARRRAMARILTEAGLEFCMPGGAFYFFPRVPVDMPDPEFTARLMEERILAVPGSGFGMPGYFRMAFCVDEKVIAGAGRGLARVVQALRSERS
ncbi:MAG: pyridoxal phosphate-dependent aminotransferase [Deltaproteobacteria bacterium]|nr:pyridoxal phosphate-dependent aminotransferase [Deltaproteobacteria bacterium]